MNPIEGIADMTMLQHVATSLAVACMTAVMLLPVVLLGVLIAIVAESLERDE